MLSLFCFVFLLLGQSLASNSANQYADNVIQGPLQAEMILENLDPNFLSSYTFEYQDGQTNFTGGRLTGLSTIKRYGDCAGPKNISDVFVIINCVLTFDSLETSYNGRAKYGGRPAVTFQAKGSVQNFLLNVDFIRTFNQITGVEVNFKSFGTRNTTFSGLGPLDEYMQFVDYNFESRVLIGVQDAIGGSKRFKSAFNRAANRVPMPFR